MRTCVFSGVPVEGLFPIHYITKKFEECLSKQVCHYERAFSVSRRACGVLYGPNIILIKADISDQKYLLSESDASQDRYTKWNVCCF